MPHTFLSHPATAWFRTNHLKHHSPEIVFVHELASSIHICAHTHTLLDNSRKDPRNTYFKQQTCESFCWFELRYTFSISLQIVRGKTWTSSTPFLLKHIPHGMKTITGRDLYEFAWIIYAQCGETLKHSTINTCGMLSSPHMLLDLICIKYRL